MFQRRWEGPRSEHQAQHHLPPIAESRTVVPGPAIQAQTQQDAQPKAERVGFQSQENLNRLNQQPLVLPLLFPGNEGNKGTRKEEDYKHLLG